MEIATVMIISANQNQKRKKKPGKKEEAGVNRREENLSVLTSLLSKYFTERLQDESSFLSKMVQLNEAFHVDFNSQTIVHDKRCNFATAAWLVFMHTAPVEASIAEMTPLVNNGYVFKPSFVHGEIPWIPGKGMFNVVLLRVHLRSMRSDDDAFLM